MLAANARAQSPPVTPRLAGTDAGEPAQPRSPTPRRVAVIWLELLDEEDYQTAWRIAAPAFRDAYEEPDGESRIRALRRPYRDLAGREVQTEEFTAILPGLPDGTYAIVEAVSRFGRRRTCRETITLSRSPSGRWQVLGYFLRPVEA